MENEMVVFSSGFLDGIAQDKPQGCWSTQLDSRLRNVTVRSLLWPGYFAFHRLSSDLFGGVYLGEGSKNVDLPFMI
jgi:radial spoke head protein 9